MDNQQQIEEINRYWFRLQTAMDGPVDREHAAALWIRKYAARWRQHHPYRDNQQAQSESC